MAKKGGDMMTMSALDKLKNALLDQVLSFDTIMQALYSNFATMHKAVVHLNRWQQQCARRVHTMTNIHAAINDIQTWTMKYKGAPLHLAKMMRPNAVELKAHS